MKIEALIARIDKGAIDEIKAAQAIRTKAINLRDRVARTGRYDDADLHEFLSIVSKAGNALIVSNSVLAEKAELRSDFFSRISREPRRPRLTNMLSALSGVILVAHERLADVDDRNPSPTEPSWVPNPLREKEAMAEKLRQDLISVVRNLKGSNSLSEVPEIDKHFRENLIDLLETVISILKAPLVEKNLFSAAGDKLKELASSLGQHGAKEFIGELATNVASTLIKLVIRN
jgi:hypothetical protein